MHTIALTTWLPKAIDPLTVDGYTQPGSSPNTLPLAQGTNAVLNVEINGAGRHARVRAGSSKRPAARIQGLVINRCRRRRDLQQGGPDGHRQLPRHDAGGNADRRRIVPALGSLRPRHARQRAAHQRPASADPTPRTGTSSPEIRAWPASTSSTTSPARCRGISSEPMPPCPTSSPTGWASIARRSTESRSGDRERTRAT